MTEIHKGLYGVTVDQTAISSVNPETNSLLYRGYPAPELARHCSFEEVAYLLWHGELPTATELEIFCEVERAQRALSGYTKAVIDAIPTTAHPMDVVRTAVSYLGATDPTAWDHSPEANAAKALRLAAQIPTIVAYDQRRRRGQQIV
ncbi:MAG: bifunctional 2-methylcitrate synthase/citrate synthase, partial [Bifidobacteriaceae bacterium]|nr:bifunctional 2-methylcitrate synthase/citrate synthase [Bifidobacteriaceae bacterium]